MRAERLSKRANANEQGAQTRGGGPCALKSAPCAYLLQDLEPCKNLFSDTFNFIQGTFMSEKQLFSLSQKTFSLLKLFSKFLLCCSFTLYGKGRV